MIESAHIYTRLSGFLAREPKGSRDQELGSVSFFFPVSRFVFPWDFHWSDWLTRNPVISA